MMKIQTSFWLALVASSLILQTKAQLCCWDTDCPSGYTCQNGHLCGDGTNAGTCVQAGGGSPPPPADDGGCFSRVATVDVLGKGVVTMEDLQVGDLVSTGNPKMYERVYSFGHREPTKMAKFVKIDTKGAKTKTSLEMTGEHLVFLQGKVNPVRADSVQVGDVLEGGTEGGARVTKVGSVERQGFYAPLTPGGTLVVNNIKASSYISFQEEAEEHLELQGRIKLGISNHKYAHVGLSPFRLLCMGVSSTLCNTYNEEGMPYYVAFSVWLNNWVHKQNFVVEVVVLSGVALVSGASMVVENTLGATYGPMMLFLAAVLGLVLVKAGVVLKAKKLKTV